ncbi:MFS general substrate transporter [Dendrothele bispora CBS 962.96]|uniref:MFS general substrate transporter n=1 Tax=Dendrothele bispora (strain CBS 962.96) TaxID=1314807 RepID=A0A4S8MV75_DENBC|nr:MFS general substrate transporter [Dendrothele bispora CBS 962.96]
MEDTSEKRDSGTNVEKSLQSPLENHDHHHVKLREVDTAAKFATGGDVDPAEAARVLRKIDIHLLPLMCTLYWVQFMDKTTLGSSAILEKRIISQTTKHLHMECRSLHTRACKNFAGLFVVRFVLGMCEGSVTAGFMIVSTMFYTRKEQTQRVGYWFLMNGTAVAMDDDHNRIDYLCDSDSFLVSALLSMAPQPYKVTVKIAFRFFFPDSPTSAWFFTDDEKRLPYNESSLYTRMYEALLDPKTWLFALFSALCDVPNSLSNQRQIIVSSLGFTNLQTTLLGCVDGIVEIVIIWSGVEIAARIPNSRGYVAAIYFLPSVLGVLLINLLPWENKVGLLFSQWFLGPVSPDLCIGSAAGPFMWLEKYKPRNHVPWIIIGIMYLGCMITLLTIRFYLSRENKRRDAEPPDDTYDNVYVERVGPDGSVELFKVDKEFLDLTDVQNREFRYVL